MYGTALLLTETGDIALTPTGQMTMITGSDKVVQDLTVLLKSSAGTYPFSSGWGVNYSAIVAANGNKSLIQSIIETALQQYPYTKSVDSVTVSFNANRQLAISVQITTSENEQISVGIST
jgi:phage baseplate assembly protein W